MKDEQKHHLVHKRKSEVQPESDIRAPHQEISTSEQKDTEPDFRAQRVSQGSENPNHDHYYGMKNLI